MLPPATQPRWTRRVCHRVESVPAAPHPRQRPRRRPERSSSVLPRNTRYSPGDASRASSVITEKFEVFCVLLKPSVYIDVHAKLF